MNAEEVIQQYDRYVLPNYRHTSLIFTKGKGCRLWDIEGKEYLDFFPGWGVSILGHCPPSVVRAIRTQAGRLLHMPNNYRTTLHARLAQEIIENAFKGKVFLANSGAEANEAVIKLARAYGHPDRYEILSMKQSFHGRTLATMTLTGQAAPREGFGPLPSGFQEVPLNDIQAVESAIRKETVAIILEPIQGEGGIHEASAEYVRALRRICDEKKMLLIFDEVQTGMGRTGKFFGFQHYDVTPDAMTLAKGLGGGVPIGAMVVAEPFVDVLRPKENVTRHATTFGGNPLVCRAALAVFETIRKEKLLLNVEKMGAYLFEKLGDLQKEFPIIQEIRGKGLMIGVELSESGKGIVSRCAEKGLLINCTQGKILRILPPLNVQKKEIDRALSILREVLAE